MSFYHKYDTLKCKAIVRNLNKKLIKKDNLEYVDRYLCKSSSKIKLCNISGLTYQKCTNCGFVYVSPRLKKSIYYNVYDKHYWFERRKAFNEMSITERKIINLTVANNRLDLVHEYMPNGSLLDIGCADASTVNAASIRGYDAYGIEISDFLIIREEI